MVRRFLPRRRIRVLAGEVARRVKSQRWRLPPPGEFKVDLGSNGDLYWVYRKMQRSLARNRMGPGLRDGFIRLGADTDTLERVDGHFAQSADHRVPAVLGLYREMMRLPSHEEVLVGYLRRALPDRLEYADADPARRGHVYAWPVAYLLDAALTAYERTGNRVFADVAAETLDRMADRRDDVTGRRDEVRGRVVAAWGGNGFVPGHHTVNVTLVGRVAEPFARFAADLPESSRAPIYAATASETLAELDGEYREERDGAGWYPVVGGERAEPLNHLAAAGRACVELHRATGDAHAMERAGALARFVRSTWYRDRGGRRVWDYDPDAITRRGRGTEFVWKAQITLGFVHRGAGVGGFGDRDLAEVCRTLTGNVFRDRGVNATIYRRFTPIEVYGMYNGGLLSVLPLMTWAGTCPGLADMIEGAVAANPVAGGWLGRPQGAIGYAARIDGGGS
jgi:hypothetical protein